VLLLEEVTMQYDALYLSLLYEVGVPENVIEHSLAVALYSEDVATRMRKAGLSISVKMASNGAILHDIGRSVTHSIRHGIEGARLIRSLHLPEPYARICERHIGAGITDDEARELGFPPGRYMPETWEEKVVAHCDNCTFGTRRVPVSHTLERFSTRVGPAVLERIKLLNKELEPYL